MLGQRHDLLVKAIRRKLEKYQDSYLFICNNYFMLILPDVSAYMSVAVIMHMICILDMFIPPYGSVNDSKGQYFLEAVVSLHVSLCKFVRRWAKV